MTEADIARYVHFREAVRLIDVVPVLPGRIKRPDDEEKPQ